jgi:hypothetical protein
MKTPFRRLLAAAWCAGLLAASVHAQAFNLKRPELTVESLDRLVSLTPEQKSKAIDIVSHAVADLENLSDQERLRDEKQVRPRMRAEIRALLTPEQLRKYDRTPQPQGGDLTLQTPENKTARLDALLALSPQQKAQAMEILSRELDDLLALPEADRLQKGAPIRQRTRVEIRDILTSVQQLKYASAPQSQGGASMLPP